MRLCILTFPPHDKPEITWGEEESILKDINSFKSNNNDPIVAILTDGSMLPEYSYGDYVGGSRIYGDNIKELAGLNCIIQLEERTIIRKINLVDDMYICTSVNQDKNIKDPILSDIKPVSAAEIIWHRWRKKIKDIKV